MEVGNKFGRLTVLKLLPPVQKKYKVLVECECGTKKVVYKNSLVRGNTISCGCYLAEYRASGDHPWKKRQYHAGG